MFKIIVAIVISLVVLHFIGLWGLVVFLGGVAIGSFK
jgi:hypothetical protein